MRLIEPPPRTEIGRGPAAAARSFRVAPGVDTKVKLWN
jgi:hypothetical protein